MPQQDMDSLSGRLRHRVTLAGGPPRPDRNALGETVDTSAGQVTTWALVETLSGRDLAYAQTLVGEATSRVTLRWRPGVDRLQTVLFDGRTLNVEAAVPDATKTTLVLYCSEET